MNPEFRCGTRKAIEELAEELNLPNDWTMQDWSYEIANSNDIEKYISHYNDTTDNDKKFVLMEIIIQATSDQRNATDFFKYWEIIKPLLTKDFSIHQFTIH